MNDPKIYKITVRALADAGEKSLNEINMQDHILGFLRLGFKEVHITVERAVPKSGLQSEYKPTL